MYSLGIDVGYSSIKFVIVDEQLNIAESIYILHKGRVKEELKKHIDIFKHKYKEGLRLGSATGQGSKFIAENNSVIWINEVTALVEGGIAYSDEIDSIIEIGGQSSKYITNISKEDNSKIKIAMNSNCSAGTGSFLEEQVSRLGIKLEDYSKLAEQATAVPRIAGRCSVFAKTDIIHHQQEGVDAKNILMGLSYALVKNYKSNVIKKNTIGSKVLLAGGVGYNTSIVKAVSEVLGLNDSSLIVPEACSNIGALGAAVIGLKERYSLEFSKIDQLLKIHKPILEIDKTSVILDALEGYGEDDSKDKHKCIDLSAYDVVNGYLGVDVGSTSTNAVLMSEDNKVIAFRYLRTKGDPILAVRTALSEINEELNKKINVLGVGVTGSGRYMTGAFVGADVIKDEITAQAKAAYMLDSDVDTIIEIGGQDSKFIKLTNGAVSDFEMNKICAAGTGSFIEEQAKKLNIEIEKFGPLALKSSHPIDLGDRCTVFIETNIASSISSGAKLEDIASGLAYSIAKNYLNKVVGKKEIGQKVFFQGGVAYNQAVINAFRSILGNKVVVPEFFSVTGALGAAVLAKEEMNGEVSLFKGFDLEEDFDFKKLKQAKVVEKAKKPNVFEETERYYLEGYEGISNPNRKTIGIPRVLFLHKLFPLFNTYFKELGFNVVLSDNSNEKIVELSQSYAIDETCYPIKLINGHVAQLIQKNVDFIFLPSLQTMAHPVSTTRQNYGCVYMQCFPKLISKTMELEQKGIKLLSPVLSFKFGKKYMMQTLIKVAEELGKNPVQASMALAKGMMAFKKFEDKVEELGERALKELKEDEKAFVIVTRAYGIADPILNMGIPEKIEKLGYKVLTLSNLPAHDLDTSLEHPNMYWPFGQHMVSGAQIIKQHPNLYAIHITNHGCGPDTAISHYFKEEMKGKPYLNIEVDEHFSSVGVLTRVEAFVNSLKSELVSKENSLTLKQCADKIVHKKTEISYELDNIDTENVLVLPYLYPFSQLMKAYLESKGYESEILMQTSKQSLDLGRKFTLSKEYLSLTALLGDVISRAKTADDSLEKLAFMIPTSEGSEVGGQYSRLIRGKLDDEKLSKAKIVSPFIEDIIKNPELAKKLSLILLAGDIVNLYPRDERSKYVAKIEQLILSDELDITAVTEIARHAKSYLNASGINSQIAIAGELNILFNDFLNNKILKSLEDKNISLTYQPTTEYLWFMWKDYLSQNTGKTSSYEKTLKEISEYMSKVSNILENFSPFADDLQGLVALADSNLGNYYGANGRYRYAKLMDMSKKAKGIISVSSMYENTNTVINILTQGNSSGMDIPLLNLTFDGNENEIDGSKIDSFIYYVLKNNDDKQVKNKRGA